MSFSWNEIVKDCVTDKGVASLACVPALFQNLVSGAILFAGLIALIFIIYSGIKFIRSGGDPKQVEAARQTLTYALIGLILILLSFFIVNFISGVSNVPCIRQFGFGNCT